MVLALGASLAQVIALALFLNITRLHSLAHLAVIAMFLAIAWVGVCVTGRVNLTG